MKKILLLAAVAFLTATGMQAQRFVSAMKMAPRQSTEQILTAKKTVNLTPVKQVLKDQTTILSGMKHGKASRAGEVDPAKILSYCPWNVENLSAVNLTQMGLPGNSTYFLGTYYGTRMVQAFAGNQITEIHTWLSPTATNVWFQILNPATGEVLWEQGGTANEVGGTQGKQVIVTLNEPYTIQADQPIIIGYTADFGATVALPYFQAGSLLDGALIGYYENDELVGFQSSDNGEDSQENFAPGMGVCMYMDCVTTGDAGLNESDVEVAGMFPGRVKAGKPCDVTFAVTNWGSQPLRAAEVAVSFDGVTYDTLAVNIPYTQTNYTAFGMSTSFTVRTTAPASVASSADLKNGWTRVYGKVCSVNGQVDAFDRDNSGNTAMLLVQDGVRRPVLVEEFTGQWCGWCVQALAGIEAAKAAFPGGILTVVSAHDGESDATSGYYDGFINKNYSEFAYNYAAGYPSCLLNRTNNFAAFSPYGQSFLNGIRNVIENTGCEASVGVASDVADGKVNVTAAIKPTMDDLNPEYYAVAFVLTEDGLTGSQTNYLSSAYGSQTGITSAEDLPADLQKYYNMPGVIEATYDDVPRFTTDLFGIEGSMTGMALSKDKTVTYNYSFDMPDGVNTENLNVIAMLVCQVTGEVVAVQAAPLGEEAFNTGIQAISNGAQANIDVTEGAINISAAQGNAQLYTVDGKLISNITVNGSASIPTFGLKGVYVVRVADGNNVTSKKVQF